MIKETFSVTGAGNQQLYVRRYEGDNSKNGVIQILHGMAEYGDRYDGFAEFLTKQGYVVFVQDHRKHGMSISGSQKVGYYTDDTWKQMVEDIEFVQKYILEREAVNKVLMIGHSMGSFLLRNYLIDFGEHVNKAIIMGTGDTDVLKSKMGLLLAKIIGKFSGHKPSKFLNDLSVGNLNKAFEPGKTGVEWLSRDEAISSWYVKNPLCGYSYTPKFYEELIKGILYIIKKDVIIKTPKIPLLFISGAMDPVGDMGIGTTKIHDIYKRLGYNVELTLFEEARHEILNELNKEEVYNRILTFIKA